MAEKGPSKGQKSKFQKTKKKQKIDFFLMSQEVLCQKIRFLGQKLWPVACRQTDTHTEVLITECPIMASAFQAYTCDMSSPICDSKTINCVFFLMSQGVLCQKIRFLGQKLWPVARSQTDRGFKEYRPYQGLSLSSFCLWSDMSGLIWPIRVVAVSGLCTWNFLPHHRFNFCTPIQSIFTSTEGNKLE